MSPLPALTPYSQNFQDSSKNDLIKTLVKPCHCSEIASNLIQSKSQHACNSLWSLQILLSTLPSLIPVLSDLILYYLSSHSASATLGFILSSKLAIVFHIEWSFLMLASSHFLKIFIKEWLFSGGLPQPVHQIISSLQHFLFHLSVLLFL